MFSKTLVLAAALAISIPAFGAEDRSKDLAAIRAHVDAIFNAYIHHDRDVIRKTHSEDWRGFLTPSRTVIRGIDEYMAAANRSIQDPNAGMTAYKMVEFDVMFHGDIAIINYVADVDGHQGDKPWKTKLRVLDIYEKRSGEWIQVGSNTCVHPDTMEH